MLLKHLGLEQAASRALCTGHHELSVALIVQRAWMPGCRRDMSPHDLPDEEVVAADLAAIMQPAFKAGVALVDQWRGDLRAG